MISNSEHRGAHLVKKIDDFNADDRIGVKLLDNSIYFLTGEIDDESVDNCIQWIVYENLDSSKKVLTLYINSTGGDLYSAFALIDVMKNSKHPIRTIGLGAVMSAAFLIFTAGSQGERYAAKNTSFMCHQYSDTISGKHHDIKSTMKDGDLCNQKMVNLLKDSTGLSPTKIKTKLLPASDVYLTATEVVNLGVADFIL